MENLSKSNFCINHNKSQFYTKLAKEDVTGDQKSFNDVSSSDPMPTKVNNIRNRLLNNISIKSSNNLSIKTSQVI